VLPGSGSGSASAAKTLLEFQQEKQKQYAQLENQLRLEYHQRMRWERPLSKEAVKYLAAQLNVDPDEMVRYNKLDTILTPH
jgi:hypothetical protein